MRKQLFCIALVLCQAFLCAQGFAQPATAERGLITANPGAAGEDPWTLTHNIALTSRLPGNAGVREDAITADLYRPRTTERVPAAVIIHSSGGLNAYVEDYHARSLASAGMASLIVDSYMPRGIRSTTDDQSRLPQLNSDADAVAAFRWLAKQPWVDPGRIIILGMSRGGSTALDVATEQYRRRLQATDIRFAAHVAITTGGCTFQPRDASTTGAPIFFMLAELDDGTIVPPCLDYADRIRKAGNANVRTAIYPGVYHALELPFGVARESSGELVKKCAGRFFTDDEHHVFERDSNTLVSAQYIRDNCIERGYTTGGEYRVREQATADLLQFLRDSEVLLDNEARAILPSCAALDGTLRRNCLRARTGWLGDLSSLGRAYRLGLGVTREPPLAARILKLAADRGHPSAQRELAVMLQAGEGVPRDGVTALALLKTAAQANAAAMNVLGNWYRDGIEVPKNDAEAVKWFQRAADLRDEYGYHNLGTMYRDGRGGLKADPVEALRLFRHSAYLENPWGRLRVAEALEKGSATAVDIPAARKLYELVSRQDREPEAKKRALDALARLSAPEITPSQQRTEIPSAQGRRLALVIGNSKYESFGAIRNPRNDAQDMAKMLQTVGFEVTLGLDLKRAAMEDTLINFAKAVRGVETALVYYAGHGVQYNGINYLAPVDAVLNDETDLRKLINLQDLIEDLQTATRVRLMFIDACRDNQGVPRLLASLPKASRAIGGRGLAQVSNAEGTLIVFATQPNRVAADGAGRNSPFTEAMLKHLPTPNIEVRTLMTRVRADVVAATPDKQRPEMFDSLVGEFVFCGDDCAKRANTSAGAK